MKLTCLANYLAIGLVLSFATVGCRKKPVGVENIPNRPIAHVPDLDTMPPVNPDFPEGVEGADTPGFVGIPLGPGHEGWQKDPAALAEHTVLFAFDSHSVPSSEMSKIAAVANHLKQNPTKAVEVEGHADERGTEEYNRSLGERRALAVREELVKQGIDPNRVDTVSFGEDRPVDPAHNEAAWRKNRRGEFILLSPPQ